MTSLGMSAMVMYNKVHVASHYTLDARMEDPSSDVLANVTADADSAAMAIDAIDNPPAPPEEPAVGKTFVLTTVRDDIDGTAQDDLIVAEPVAQVSNVFQETLNPFDDIDGGDGNDTIAIYGVVAADDLELGAESVRNVENVILNTVGGMDVDLSHWDGLESVNLERYGRGSDVAVTVDGAMVTAERAFGGDVTIVGAMGALNIEAGSGSMVHVGSGSHTESVMVKGGASIKIDNGAGKQSTTITSVSVEGVMRDEGDVVTEPSGKYEPRMDVDGFVVGEDGVTRVTIVGATSHPDGTLVKLGNANDDGNILLVGTDSSPVFNGDDETPIVFDPSTGKISGDLEDVVPTPSVGRKMGTMTSTKNEGPTLEVLSDSISDVSLTKTNAIVKLQNASKTADDKPMLEDLSVTVDHYGKYGDGQPGGKLCVIGADDIMIDVVGKSEFALASDQVKSLSILADANLTLDVNKFNNTDTSSTLESLMISGSGDVKIADVTMSKLATVDASGASGDVILGLEGSGFGKTVTSYMGGSGFDCITVSTFAAKGVSVELGAGNDVFKAGAGNKDSRIDGGDGMDTLMLTSGGGSTYQDSEKKSHSIYSGFEALDAGGGSGGYDIAMLGVQSVQVGRSTEDEGVTFQNMADGMGISVHGEKPKTATADGGTIATIVHEIVERKAGQPRFSGQLEVSLVANGNSDTKSTPSGQVDLTLTAADEIDTLIVDSSANVSVARTATPATIPTAGDYVNKIKLDVNDDGATVEELFVTGDAGLTITASDNAFAKVELVDATANSGGVTFRATEDGSADGTELTGNLEIHGSSADDVLMGGAGMDEITGGSGADELDGGSGNDMFIYNAASESQLSFGGAARNMPQGTDEISGFESGDKIVLSKTIWAAVKGKTITEYQVGPEGEGESLKAVVDSQGKAAAGGGFFITVEAADNTSDLLGGGSKSTQHGIVSVEDGTDRWVFIDANGDGKFSSGDDLVIKLVGGDGPTPTIELVDFMVAS